MKIINEYKLYEQAMTWISDNYGHEEYKNPTYDIWQLVMWLFDNQNEWMEEA